MIELAASCGGGRQPGTVLPVYGVVLLSLCFARTLNWQLAELSQDSTMHDAVCPLQFAAAASVQQLDHSRDLARDQPDLSVSTEHNETNYIRCRHVYVVGGVGY